MKRLISMFTVITFLAAGAGGCTSMKPLPNANPAAPFQGVSIGQRVRVIDKAGTATDIAVVNVGPDFVEGRTADRQVVRYDAADISQLSTRQPALGKTVALTVGMVYLAAFAALADAGWVLVW